MQSKIQKEVTTCGKGLEVPCQNTFKPAFIKRLIKVFVAKNLLLVHRSSFNKKSCLKGTTQTKA